MNAIIDDGRECQYTEDTRSLFKPHIVASFPLILIDFFPKDMMIVY